MYHDLHKSAYHALFGRAMTPNFDPFRDADGYLTVEDFTASLLQRIPQILEEVSNPWPAVCLRLSPHLQATDGIYRGLALLSQRKLEPHNRNRNPDFDYVDRLQAGLDRLEM